MHKRSIQNAEKPRTAKAISPIGLLAAAAAASSFLAGNASQAQAAAQHNGASRIDHAPTHQRNEPLASEPATLRDTELLFSPNTNWPDFINKAGEKPRCFSPEDRGSRELTEQLKKADTCYNMLSTELRTAYHNKQWTSVIGVSKEMIAIAEYLNAESSEQPKEFTGIGIEIRQQKENGGIAIANVITGSPAEKSGLKAGDIVIAVDGQSTLKASSEEAINLIRGKAGTAVTLTIRRNNNNQDRSITRAKVSATERRQSLWMEYSLLHHAYFMLDRTREASDTLPQARKEIDAQFGPESDELADLLEKHVILLALSEADYAKHAKEPAEEAIAIISRNSSKDKGKRLWNLHNLASYSLLKAGDYDSAARHINHALVYYQLLRRPKDRDIELSKRLARNLSGLAVFCDYSSMSTSRCAEYSNKAYEMARKHLEPSDLEYRGALRSLAETLSDTEPLEAWIPLYREAIEIGEKHDKPKTHALNLQALALKLSTVNASEALAYQLRASAIIEGLNGQQSVDSLLYRIKAADIYRFAGLHESAYSAYTDIRKRLSANSEEGQDVDGKKIQLYGELAKGFLALGEASEMASIQREITRIGQRYPKDPGALASMAFAKSLYEAFVDHNYSQAIASYSEGQIHLKQAYLSPQAQGAGWEIGLNESRMEGSLLDQYEDISALQALNQDYGSAASTISEAIEYLKRKKSSRSWKLKYLYAQLARYQGSHEELENASTSASEALSLALADAPQIAMSEFYLLSGAIAGLRNQPETAHKHFIAFTKAQIGELSSRLWRTPDSLRTIELINSSTDGFNYLFYNYGSSPAYYRAALYARLNLHGLSAELERKQSQLASANPPIRALASSIKAIAKRSSLTDLTSVKKKSLQNELVSKEALLMKLMPGLQHKLTTVEEVAASIPKTAILIEIIKVTSYPKIDRAYPIDHEKQSRYIALTLDHQGSVNRFDLGDASIIDRTIEEATKASSAGLSDSVELWSKAARQLLDPLQEIINTKPLVFISPDSEVNKFPFSAIGLLPSQNPIRKDVRFVVVTTGRDITQLNNDKAELSQAIVIANPEYGIRQSTDSEPGEAQSQEGRLAKVFATHSPWKPLPASAVEGKRVASLLNARLLEGDHATESQAKSLRSPRIFHFASHAFFVKLPGTFGVSQSEAEHGRLFQGVTFGSIAMTRALGSQSLSGVVLAGANSDGNSTSADGYLTAEEMATLDWSGTELVVVSGCDSGVGESLPGDGLYGLRRAIAVAGADSSLLSLWKVDDEASAEFMVRFYSRVSAGESLADALAATQKEFRDGTVGDGKWTDLYYWGAWQLVGDWRPIPDL